MCPKGFDSFKQNSISDFKVLWNYQNRGGECGVNVDYNLRESQMADNEESTQWLQYPLKSVQHRRVGIFFSLFL